MTFFPTVHATIIKVAGDWALSMATTPEYSPDTKKYEPVQPSQISDELEKDFDFAYKFLTSYLK